MLYFGVICKSAIDSDSNLIFAFERHQSFIPEYKTNNMESYDKNEKVFSKSSDTLKGPL